MPEAPLHYCPGSPTCRVRVRGGLCPEHARQKARARATSTQRGYSYRWVIRAAAFRRQYPLCGMRPKGQAPVLSACALEGRVTAAAVVDHVVPHRGNQALMWDEIGNWQSLCAVCHARKTAAGR